MHNCYSKAPCSRILIFIFQRKELLMSMSLLAFTGKIYVGNKLCPDFLSKQIVFFCRNNLF